MLQVCYIKPFVRLSMFDDVVLLRGIGLRLDDAVVSFTLHFLPEDNPFKD